MTSGSSYSKGTRRTWKDTRISHESQPLPSNLLPWEEKSYYLPGNLEQKANVWGPFWSGKSWICTRRREHSGPSRPDSDEWCWIPLTFHQSLQGGDLRHWAQALQPFLSRHLQDRKTSEKLTGSKEEGGGKEASRWARQLWDLGWGRDEGKGDGSWERREWWETMEGFSSVLRILDPYWTSLFPHGRISWKLYLLQNVSHPTWIKAVRTISVDCVF